MIVHWVKNFPLCFAAEATCNRSFMIGAHVHIHIHVGAEYPHQVKRDAEKKCIILTMLLTVILLNASNTRSSHNEMAGVACASRHFGGDYSNISAIN